MPALGKGDGGMRKLLTALRHWEGGGENCWQLWGIGKGEEKTVDSSEALGREKRKLLTALRHWEGGGENCWQLQGIGKGEEKTVDIWGRKLLTALGDCGGRENCWQLWGVGWGGGERPVDSSVGENCWQLWGMGLGERNVNSSEGWDWGKELLTALKEGTGGKNCWQLRRKGLGERTVDGSEGRDWGK